MRLNEDDAREGLLPVACRTLAGSYLSEDRPAKFVYIDRDTTLLLPPGMRGWISEDHLVHLIIDAVEQLDLRQARVNERGSGNEQYPPSLQLALLIYRYALAGITQSNHDFARFFLNRSVNTVGACSPVRQAQGPEPVEGQAISPLHPPSPRLRRTGREHLSAVASCEGGSSLRHMASTIA